MRSIQEDGQINEKMNKEMMRSIQGATGCLNNYIGRE